LALYKFYGNACEVYLGSIMLLVSLHGFIDLIQVKANIIASILEYVKNILSAILFSFFIENEKLAAD
jgi:hypothetical protein